jgi:hypothetical protein
MTTPPAVLALSGRGYAELRLDGVLYEVRGTGSYPISTLTLLKARKDVPPSGPSIGRLRREALSDL